MNKEIISIVVLSYNSNKTIIETLDSILIQDYGSQFIELIIGDDASQDNTQNIIKDWVNKNNDKFHCVILNLQKENQGVVANFNSSCNLATSNWIKPIAADDILMSNCITKFNLFTLNKSVSCIFCKVERFNNNQHLGITPSNNYYFNLSAKKQFENLLIDNFLPAPGSFFKKHLLRDVQYIDESLNMEDYPFWLKLTKKGIKLYLLDSVLVKYRIANSLSNSSHRLINIKLNRDVYNCKMKYYSELNSNFLLKTLILIDIKLFLLTNFVKIYIFNKKKNKLSLLLSPLLRVLSPLYILRKKNSKKNNHR